MTTTTTTAIDKVATLKERNELGAFHFFHYTVSSFEAANYNAEYDLPEYYMWEREETISGIKYTYYKSYSDGFTAVKMENENWGISVSYYEDNEWSAEYLYEIVK